MCQQLTWLLSARWRSLSTAAAALASASAMRAVRVPSAALHASACVSAAIYTASKRCFLVLANGVKAKVCSR
jgi:hypothetical protein